MPIQRLVSANYLREGMRLCNHAHALMIYSHGLFSNGQQTDEHVHDRIARMHVLLSDFRCARHCAAAICLGRQILGRFREERVSSVL
jgi:hypothetical protein